MAEEQAEQPDFVDEDVVEKNEDGTPKVVRYSALEGVIAKRNELKAWRAENEPKLAQLTEFETFKGTVEKERATWAEERSLFSVGLDAEGHDVARMFYGRIPEAERPKDGIGAWVASLKGDLTKAPKALAPYLAPAGGGGGVTTTTTVVDTNQHVVTPAGGPPVVDPVTDEALDAIVAHALKTGDFSEYDKHREKILARKPKGR